MTNEPGQSVSKPTSGPPDEPAAGLPATRVLVDLERLERNYRRLVAAHRRRRIMAVLKANAYGHGLEPVARFLQARGQELFGVARLDEALALRQAGIGGRILVLGAPEPGRRVEYRQHAIEMTLPSLEHLREAAAHPEDGPLFVQLKLDSGMGRIGIPLPEPEAVHELLARARHLVLRGVYSHLAEAESLASPFSQGQLAAFQAFQARLLERWSGPIPDFHIANSAALLRDASFHLDYARVGYALWAPVAFDPPEAQPALNAELEQVLTLRCPVSLVKRMREGDTVGYSRTHRCAEGETIATLPIGYGDGYFRALSNRGQVLLGGRRHPVVGNVSMDQTTVSLGTGTARLGEEVTLLGGGAGAIALGEMARWAGTIGYEILTHLNGRLPRVYLHDGREWPPEAIAPLKR
jgi:alanine racemase